MATVTEQGQKTHIALTQHPRTEDGQHKGGAQSLTTLLRREYRGWWVVVDRKWTRLIGASKDPAEAMKFANQAGREDAVVVHRIPHEHEDLPFAPTEIGVRSEEGNRGVDTSQSD